jgi:methionyl-tRNA formyltransferase
MKIGILTSVETRHRYFVSRLCERVSVAAVVYERTGFAPATVEAGDLTPAEARIVSEHFAERARQEEVFFGAQSEVVIDSATVGVRTIDPGQLNSAETLEFLRARDVDTVVVYGTNLIAPPLIDAWPGRMINMHLGLSPYYRGTATNFYPLLNEEPEYVGATIHLIDAGIDSGPIVKHARPTIVAGDQPHTIGCKAILAGIDAMIAVLARLAQGGMVEAVPQWPVANPRVYLRKDYHPRHTVELYRKLDAGMIERFVEREARRPTQLRLVE